MAESTGNRTLCIIKPEAVATGQTGSIIEMIEKSGFRILAMKMCRMGHSAAQAFYEVHREKPFFDDLVEYMISGPIVAIALEKENAVQAYRQLIGATNPAEARPGSVRNLFGINKTSNAVHGSDSDENATIEIAFFFSRFDMESVR